MRFRKKSFVFVIVFAFLLFSGVFAKDYLSNLDGLQKAKVLLDLVKDIQYKQESNFSKKLVFSIRLLDGNDNFFNCVDFNKYLNNSCNVKFVDIYENEISGIKNIEYPNNSNGYNYTVLYNDSSSKSLIYGLFIAYLDDNGDIKYKIPIILPFFPFELDGNILNCGNCPLLNKIFIENPDSDIKKLTIEYSFKKQGFKDFNFRVTLYQSYLKDDVENNGQFIDKKNYKISYVLGKPDKSFIEKYITDLNSNIFFPIFLHISENVQNITNLFDFFLYSDNTGKIDNSFLFVKTSNVFFPLQIHPIITYYINDYKDHNLEIKSGSLILLTIKFEPKSVDLYDVSKNTTSKNLEYDGNPLTLDFNNIVHDGNFLFSLDVCKNNLCHTFYNQKQLNSSFSIYLGDINEFDYSEGDLLDLQYKIYHKSDLSNPIINSTKKINILSLKYPFTISNVIYNTETCNIWKNGKVSVDYSFRLINTSEGDYAIFFISDKDINLEFYINEFNYRYSDFKQCYELDDCSLDDNNFEKNLNLLSKYSNDIKPKDIFNSESNNKNQMNEMIKYYAYLFNNGDDNDKKLAYLFAFLKAKLSDTHLAFGFSLSDTNGSFTRHAEIDRNGIFFLYLGKKNYNGFSFRKHASQGISKKYIPYDFNVYVKKPFNDSFSFTSYNSCSIFDSSYNKNPYEEKEVFLKNNVISFYAESPFDINISTYEYIDPIFGNKVTLQYWNLNQDISIYNIKYITIKSCDNFFDKKIIEEYDSYLCAIKTYNIHPIFVEGSMDLKLQDFENINKDENNVIYFTIINNTNVSTDINVSKIQVSITDEDGKDTSNALSKIYNEKELSNLASDFTLEANSSKKLFIEIDASKLDPEKTYTLKVSYDSLEDSTTFVILGKAKVFTPDMPLYLSIVLIAVFAFIFSRRVYNAE